MKLNLSNVPLAIFCVASLKALIIEPSYQTLGALLISGSISFLLLLKIKDNKLEDFDKKVLELEKRIEESEKLVKEARTYTSSIKLSQQLSGKN